jgi:hypothetical protein
MNYREEVFARHPWTEGDGIDPNRYKCDVGAVLYELFATVDALRAREQRLKAALEPMVKFAEYSKGLALSFHNFEEAARIEGIIKTARAALNEGEGKVTL